MIITLVLIAIFVLIVLESQSNTQTNSTSQPHVSTNTIVLPNDIVCPNCGNDKFNPIRDLDTNTFDIICPECKEVAWINPNREERIQQLNSMIDMLD